MVGKERIKEIHYICPICKSTNVRTFFTRANVPVHQNLICRDRKSAVELPRGNLAMTVCENCGFVFNKDFNPALLSYGEDYDNTQTCSPLFEKYILDLISYLVRDRNVKNCSIVEVGCGNGFFIKKMVEEGRGNIGIGFDPSYCGQLEDLNGRVRFEKKFYGPDYTGIRPDIVICRHVIEHIPNPINIVIAIRKALRNSPKARIFFETPCVEWILRNNVVWDFFYEHCSLFTKSSLKTAFQLSGFEVINVRDVFGEQYLWLEAIPANASQDVVCDPRNILNLAESFSEKEAELKRFWSQKIETLKQDGGVAVWGGGAKGVTFVNLIDPKIEQIDCIIDLNPRKEGKYIPGTGHEIIGIKKIKSKGIATIIAMNPNYVEEIKAIVKNLNLKITML